MGRTAILRVYSTAHAYPYDNNNTIYYARKPSARDVAKFITWPFNPRGHTLSVLLLHVYYDVSPRSNNTVKITDYTSHVLSKRYYTNEKHRITIRDVAQKVLYTLRRTIRINIAVLSVTSFEFILRECRIKGSPTVNLFHAPSQLFWKYLSYSLIDCYCSY